MIRRRDQHGLVLIPQAEVARIAAELAGQLGGEIEPPTGAAAIARAATLSQHGWEEPDDFPCLDSRQLPCAEEDLPLLDRLAAWERTTHHVWGLAEEGATQLRAAALLSILAMQWAAKPALHRGETQRLNFEFNRLLHLEAERLGAAGEALGLRPAIATRHGLPEAGVEMAQLTRPERELVREVRLLEMLLELARELCGRTVVQRTLGVCARRWNAGEELVRGQWVPEGNVFHISPWCFAAPRLQLNIQARTIAPRRYRDQADLRNALTQGAELSLAVELSQPGGALR